FICVHLWLIGFVMPTAEREIETLANQEYKWGFVTDIEADSAPPGLNEEIVRFISKKKNEPDWLLEWRLKAKRHRLTREEPHSWPKLKYPPIDYQSTIYYSAPKQGAKYKSIDDVPKEILETYDKLGIPLNERKALLGIETEGHAPVAVDAVFDSVSV